LKNRTSISFAVSVVSQVLNSPCANHWNAIIPILKYIKGSSGKGLIYGHNIILKLSVIQMLIGQDLLLI